MKQKVKEFIKETKYRLQLIYYRWSSLIVFWILLLVLNILIRIFFK